MAYNHTTWTQLKTNLSQRLGDTSENFWVEDEIEIYLSESLRTFGILSAFWRERGTVALTAGQYFFDLTTALSGSLLTSTITDRDLIEQIQYALLESTSTQTSWPGTSQFTYNDIVNAITQYRNQFLSDTGIIVTRSTDSVVAPLDSGRIELSQSILDVRRAAWVGLSPQAYYSLLWREDERALTLANSNWADSEGTPTAYSVMSTPPLQIQLAPPPITNGTLDLITVNVGPTLDPANSATALGIPDDLTPAIKWGALSYLLSIDGQARDTSRAEFCAKRYQQYVELARLLSSIVHCELNGVSTIPDTLYSLDCGVPNWQDQTGVPNYIAMAGWNMFGVYPVPDSLTAYSATFDVVKKTPIPTADGDYVQISQDLIDAVLEYAVHLALFKVGGYEWASTFKLADEFLLQAITYNQRLSASARYIITPKESGQREKAYRARRQQSDALGAASSVQEAQSFVKARVPTRIKNNA